MQIVRPPPVLIVQLKRFRQVGNMWRKIQASVDFPLKNFDVIQSCQSPDFLKKEGIETKYNLLGCVNHVGTLSYGHYTSIVLNHFDSKWYLYDDAKVSEANEQ